MRKGALQVCLFLFHGVNRKVADHRSIITTVFAVREPLLKCSNPAGDMPVLKVSAAKHRLWYWTKGQRVAPTPKLRSLKAGTSP
jgi:hypothetical protein